MGSGPAAVLSVGVMSCRVKAAHGSGPAAVLMNVQSHRKGPYRRGVFWRHSQVMSLDAQLLFCSHVKCGSCAWACIKLSNRYTAATVAAGSSWGKVYVSDAPTWTQLHNKRCSVLWLVMQPKWIKRPFFQ